MVHGGQQPISGSAIELWAVGTTADGSQATLLNSAVTSDASGNFNLTGAYSCPSATTLVYITARGGNPGSGSNNSHILLMAALGQCRDLSSSTFIQMNEVTTAGAAFALAYYTSGYNSVGSSASEAGSLATAFSVAGQLVNVSNGTAQGNAPADYGLDVGTIYTVADILAACVNSGSDGTACNTLSDLTGGSGDILSAAVHIARNPNANVQELCALITSNAPWSASSPSKFGSVPTNDPPTVNYPPATKPVISPTPGSTATFASSQVVTITDTEYGDTIYYTRDGSTPTSYSYIYTGPINVAATQTITAVATAPSKSYSSAALATFTFSTTPSTTSGIVTTLAGNFNDAVVDYKLGDGAQAILAELSGAYDIAFDSSGNAYIADAYTNRIRKVATDGTITTVAGNGTEASTGDGGQAVNASLKQPESVAVDSNGNLYIAEAEGDRIRKVTPGGVISTYAGTGVRGYFGDNGPATSAKIAEPVGLAITSDGTLYVAELAGSRVRKITPGGTISTIAGDGTCGSTGDGGPATSAKLCYASDVALDTYGNIYISDQNNGKIRKINTSNSISTFAGTGTLGYSGDGGLATAAKLYYPQGLAIDSNGNIYVADYYSSRIRKIGTDNKISTIAGDGTFTTYKYAPVFPGGLTPTGGQGPDGEGTQATNVGLGGVRGMTLDSNGDLYYSDEDNNTVRKVTH